jgi:hypothetical protein
MFYNVIEWKSYALNKDMLGRQAAMKISYNNSYRKKTIGRKNSPQAGQLEGAAIVTIKIFGFR